MNPCRSCTILSNWNMLMLFNLFFLLGFNFIFTIYFVFSLSLFFVLWRSTVFVPAFHCVLFSFFCCLAKIFDRTSHQIRNFFWDCKRLNIHPNKGFAKFTQKKSRAVIIHNVQHLTDMDPHIICLTVIEQILKNNLTYSNIYVAIYVF